MHSHLFRRSPNVAASDSLSSSLLIGVRTWQAGAWRRMVHIYGPLVYRWCLQAGLSRPDAEDLGQEVFRAVASSVDRFQRRTPEDTFGGWLRTITQRKVADFWRQKARQPHTINAQSINEFGPASVPEARALQADGELRADRALICRRALDLIQTEFKENSWKAFWATAVEGRTTADVAADLNMTPAAVRKAKSRVLRRLREEFDGLGDLDD